MGFSHFMTCDLMIVDDTVFEYTEIPSLKPKLPEMKKKSEKEKKNEQKQI